MADAVAPTTPPLRPDAVPVAPAGVVERPARRRWIGSVFGTLPTGSLRHRPADVVRAVVGALVVVAASAGVGRLSGAQRWAIDLVAPIPGAFDSLLSLLAWVGALGPPVVVLVAAVVGRRGRLLTAIVLTGGAGAMGAWFLAATVDPVSPSTLAAAGIGWSASTTEFPAVGIALVAAAVLGASPFLTPTSRRLAVAGLAVSSACVVCLLEQLPLAVVASLALAGTCAALVHLALGSPAGVPSTSDVADALTDLGVAVADVGDGEEEVTGVRRFRARTSDGAELVVSVLGADAAHLGVVHRALRRAWLKDAGPALPVSREATAEHQALLLLMAERAGIAVPSLVAAGTAGALDDPMVVTTAPEGTPLDQVAPEALTDDVLGAAWAALSGLHATGLAHGDLRATAVLVRPDGSVGFDGLVQATFARQPGQLASDHAALLLTTAGLVGEGRAVAALERALGRGALEGVLPLLQPAAFSARLRRSVPDSRHLLPRLRRCTAEVAQVEAPELQQLRRVSPANLLMALGALLGVYLLVGELSSIDGLRSMLSDASLGWIVLVAVLSQTPQVAQAVGMIGSVTKPIPLGPATAVQFANQFMGLVGGTVASTALVIRYFQRMGLAAAVAVSSGVLNTLAAMVTQAVLVAVALLATRGEWTLPTSSTGGGSSGGGHTIALIILVAAVVGGVLLTLPRIRHRLVDRIRPQFDAARENLREVRRRPRKAVELFGGAVASQVLFALTLGAALQAYGESLPLLQLIVVNSFASLMGGIAPVPGGMGVIEAGLIMGLVAAGVPQEEATAATFTHRLFTAYLPPIWGWFSLRWLRRKSYV